MDAISYLTPLEVESRYKIPIATQATMRSRGGGPIYIKRGSRVIYRDCDVREWLEAGLRESTSDTGAQPRQRHSTSEPESTENRGGPTQVSREDNR